MSVEEISIQRLRWQCRRGLLELDLIFEAFLNSKSGYEELSAVQKEGFQALLLNSDHDLQKWVMGKAAPEDQLSVDLVKRIRATAD